MKTPEEKIFHNFMEKDGYYYDEVSSSFIHENDEKTKLCYREGLILFMKSWEIRHCKQSNTVVNIDPQTGAASLVYVDTDKRIALRRFERWKRNEA